MAAFSSGTIRKWNPNLSSESTDQILWETDLATTFQTTPVIAEIDATGDFTLDAAGDIILNADVENRDAVFESQAGNRLKNCLDGRFYKLASDTGQQQFFG